MRVRTKEDFIALFLIISSLALVIYSFFRLNKQFTYDERPKEYWESGNYRPDTIIFKPYINIPQQQLPNYVPPKVVINYTPAENGNFINFTDSVLRVLDSMGKSIANIDPNYLKQYPLSPKILKGFFDSDSLSLDLLNIDGKISTLGYTVNYDRFEYQFLNGQLSAKEVMKPKINSKPQSFSGGLYLNAGYSWLDKNPNIGINHQFNFKRLQLSNEALLFINQNPKLYLTTKAGYKIF